jgi:uncharacterized membrane protein (DUF441 family)
LWVGLGDGVGVAVGDGAIVTGIVFGAVVGVALAVGVAVGEEGSSPAVSMLVGTPDGATVAVDPVMTGTGGTVGES